jgi:hypothetical protein
MPRKIVRKLRTESLASRNVGIVSKRAQERSKALGIAYAVQEDDKLVLIHPDNTKEVLRGGLPTKVTVNKKVIVRKRSGLTGNSVK